MLSNINRKSTHHAFLHEQYHKYISCWINEAELQTKNTDSTYLLLLGSCLLAEIDQWK